MFLAPRLAAVALLGAAVAFAVGAATPASTGAALAVTDGLVIAGILLDVALAPSPRALNPIRIVPPVLSVGRNEQIDIVMRNPTGRPLRSMVRDAAPPSLGCTPVIHHVTLEPDAVMPLRSEVRPTRRGSIPLGPMTVRVHGPFGLAGRQTTLRDTTAVKVYPALPSRAEVMLRLDSARLLQVGERSASVRGGGTEFDSLREYHPDDEFRRINWRATARTQRPITNVYREERNQQVMLLLDAGRSMAATVGGAPRFEHAIDAAVAVAELATRVGDHIGMLAFGADVVSMIGPKGSSAQPQRIIDALYAVEPRLEAAGYRRGFGALLARHRRRSLLVLLTELAGEPALEPLIDAIPMLLSRHLLIVGAVLDPELERLAMDPAPSSEQVYEKAAAAAALAARARAAAHLRRMGAIVVDLPPGKLAGRLADEYLRIKAFGRL